MTRHLTDDVSTLMQVMAWCCQVTNHFLNQILPRSMSSYGVKYKQRSPIALYAYAAIRNTVSLIVQTRGHNIVNTPWFDYKHVASCHNEYVCNRAIFFFNSSVPRKCSSNFKSALSKHILQIKFMGTSCEIDIKWMPQTPLMTSQHWFRQWLGAVRQQASAWANVDPDLCCQMASLVPIELKMFFFLMSFIFIPQDKFHAFISDNNMNFVACEAYFLPVLIQISYWFLSTFSWIHQDN